jgi:excisionase family DNA binding protein
MGDQFYSAEEASQVLGLQVRTVRNYIRDGRLPGVRIGKQYRIARADLEAFTGSGAARAEATTPTAVGRGVEVSSVILVDGIGEHAAAGVMSTLDAAVAGGSGESRALRVEPIYDEQRSRLKVIVVGDAGDAVEIIRMVEALARDRG